MAQTVKATPPPETVIRAAIEALKESKNGAQARAAAMLARSAIKDMEQKNTRRRR